MDSRDQEHEVAVAATICSLWERRARPCEFSSELLTAKQRESVSQVRRVVVAAGKREPWVAQPAFYRAIKDLSGEKSSRWANVPAELAS